MLPLNRKQPKDGWISSSRNRISIRKIERLLIFITQSEAEVTMPLNIIQQVPCVNAVISGTVATNAVEVEEESTETDGITVPVCVGIADTKEA